jgi:hypothetical protein
MGTFSANISKFVKKTKIKPDLVVRKLAFDAYDGVLALSPVDTGRFRNNWQIGLGVTNTQTTDTGGMFQGTSVGSSAPDPQKLALIGQAKFGVDVIISNNLPYALRLENGWSKQAPTGVLKVAYAQLVASFDKAVKAVDDGVK